MAISKKVLKEQIKAKYFDLITKFLAENGEEILVTKANTFCFPVVDSEGNEEFVKVVISIPTGTRNPDKTVTPFDAYLEAEGYRVELKVKEEKAKEKAKKKAEKIRKDEAYRKKKAEQQQKREEG